jgi:hypothetical protein
LKDQTDICLVSVPDLLASYFSILAVPVPGGQRRMVYPQDRVTVNDMLQTPYMTAGEINIGWGAIFETFEMRSVGINWPNVFPLFRY